MEFDENIHNGTWSLKNEFSLLLHFFMWIFFYHLDGNSGASFKISKNNTVGTFPTIFVSKKITVEQEGCFKTRLW
jgi:hypothetical protein